MPSREHSLPDPRSPGCAPHSERYGPVPLHPGHDDRTTHPARTTRPFGPGSGWLVAQWNPSTTPSSELIKTPASLAVQKGVGHHTSYSVIPQPNRTESSFVYLAVESEEGPSGGCGAGAFACQPLHQLSPRHGTGQPPSDEQKASLADIGMPVRELSPVEHTDVVRGRGGRSPENVEVDRRKHLSHPGAGASACQLRFRNETRGGRRLGADKIPAISPNQLILRRFACPAFVSFCVT